MTRDITSSPGDWKNTSKGVDTFPPVLPWMTYPNKVPNLLKYKYFTNAVSDRESFVRDTQTIYVYSVYSNPIMK